MQDVKYPKQSCANKSALRPLGYSARADAHLTSGAQRRNLILVSKMKFDLPAIKAALDRAGGDRGYAAVILSEETGTNVTAQDVNRFIAGHDDLNALYCRNSDRPPTEAESLHREPKNSTTEIDIAMAMQDQDRLLRIGLGRLNLPPAALEIAQGIAAFNRAHSLDALHMLCGGVSRLAIMVQAEADEVHRRLEEVRKLLAGETDRDPVVENGKVVGLSPREALLREENALMMALQAYMGEARKMAEVGLKAMLTNAMVFRNLRGGKDGKEKPKFVPVSATVK